MEGTSQEPAELERYFDRLWPLLRSITGDGVRRTHDILSEILPLQRMEVPSGTKVLDWTVPPEWVVREAFVVAPTGERLWDVKQNTLHLVSYSAPFSGRVSKQELEKHLYSLPHLPNAIPYMVSYYEKRWGFCVRHDERLRLPEGEYEVVIDTDFIEGSLTLSECVLPGETPQEVLLSTYTCHPSLANNELSGPLVTAFLYRRLAALPRRRLTYRFVFIPETIGSITYLAHRGDHLKRHLIAGYVVTCVGDPGPFTYKYSRRGDSLADRVAEYCLRRREDPPPRLLPFFPTGSDERQYCSPGFDLPVGSIMRTRYAQYPQYHTSLDNKDFISFEAMVESIDVYFEVCRVLDGNRRFRNLFPYGEPNLGKHGLYPTLSGDPKVADIVAAMMWVLNQSDGGPDLLAIAQQSGLAFEALVEAAERCQAAGVLEEIGAGSRSVPSP